MEQKRRKKGNLGKRFIAALLLSCLILTTPDMSVFAERTESLSENSAGGQAVWDSETEPESLSADGICGDFVPDTQDGGYTSEIKEVPSGTPSNPVHRHTGLNDGTDTTEWSYVYFGAYPQGEVTDEATKQAIDSAISQGKGQAAGTEGSSEGIDVWVGNAKYRRISKEDCNYNSAYFDNVENNGYRYFKWERIRWRVLQNDGNTLFVAADMAVDCKNYNDAVYTSITWENCTLRSWLNNSFYQTAFTDAEKEAVVAQTVVNEDNRYYNTEGGNDTTDNVYLLSIGEATDTSYGFCSDDSVFSDSRRLKTSDYANARGARRNTFTEYEGNCWWWLRTPGGPSKYAANVDAGGIASDTGSNAVIYYNGVVPALHINLSSDLWSMKNTPLVMPSNPVHHHTGSNDGTDTTEWSYVYFGAYPQGEVTDEATKQAIDSAISQGNGQPAGTKERSEGTDVWVGDTRYRRISKEDCNDSWYFGDRDNYRYFKWERIKWRVLNNNGSTLFVAADMAVDCKDYNDIYTDVTWETCTLRKWLNDSFYKNAFSSAEQEAIVAQTVVNENNPDDNTEGGNDTTDNVYLLSIGEATDTSYGFCSDYYVYSDSRRLKISDYANVRGANRITSMGYEGNCAWWLRSPGWNSHYAVEVESNGYVDRDGCNVGYNHEGVVPALHVDLFSNLWDIKDEESSGTGGEGSDDENIGGTGDNNQGGGNVKASGIIVSGISKKIAAGKKISLSAEVLPKDATDKSVTWTSSNPKYATVDANGVAKMNKAGVGKTVTITATAKDGSGVCAQYKIKIMKHTVKKVKITASSKKVKAGGKLKLKAAVETTGKNANKKLKWISSNESYATVSSGGVVKTTKAGKGKTVTITAMATDGSGKKSKVTIKIG